jgi:hypothetical protein
VKLIEDIQAQQTGASKSAKLRTKFTSPLEINGYGKCVTEVGSWY